MRGAIPGHQELTQNLSRLLNTPQCMILLLLNPMSNLKHINNHLKLYQM